MRLVSSRQALALLGLLFVLFGTARAQTEGVYGSLNSDLIEGVSDNGNGTFHVFLMDGWGTVTGETDLSSELVSDMLSETLGADYMLLSTAQNISYLTASADVDVTVGPAESVTIGYGIVTNANETWFVGRIGDLDIGEFGSGNAEDNAGDFLAGISVYLQQEGTMNFQSYANMSNLMSDLLDTFDSAELEFQIEDCMDRLQEWIGP